MRYFTLFFLLLLTQVKVFATHNRAGEILYRQLSQPYTFEVTIITYTVTNGSADRPSLTLFWGDNTSDSVVRVNGNGNGEVISPEVKKNIYIAQHQYIGAGVFKVYFEDPNRNAGVLNIPNSVNIPFYVESFLYISPFLGYNNSPVLLNPPIDNAIVNQKFIHNPGAFDTDGDSLSYKLVINRGEAGANIPGYVFPSAISPGPGNVVSLDSLTGDFVWNSPKQIGEYNIAILITEYRQGIVIGSVLRDLQITVKEGPNKSPIIQPLQDICITAGDTVDFDVTAIDPDNDQVVLTATGGPFQIANPAFFTQPVSGTGVVTSNFIWSTKCSHVRKQPYQVYFKAEDNDPDVRLADMKTVQITVVSPSPENLTAVPMGNTILVSWTSGLCTNAIGYKLYRRANRSNFIPSPCETGVPAYTGYQLIRTIEDVNVLSFTDSDNGAGLDPGTEYCYMINSYFADSADSYASREVCTELKKDVPIITHVDVMETSETNGKIFIDWSRPTEIDTIQNPGPYQYRLFRAESSALAGTQVYTGVSLNDTTFTDSILNTSGLQYFYYVEFYASPGGVSTFIGATRRASSVFISLIPSDDQLTVVVNAQVPWRNSLYTIYKEDSAGVFDSIAITSELSYVDRTVKNGNTYCYKVRSRGAYSSPGLVDPIINFSQEVCGIPIDNVAPCAPSLVVSGDCDRGENSLSWTNPNNSCADDVASYTLFYKPTYDSPYALVKTFAPASEVSYTHLLSSSIAGCYFITASDSTGNISDSSEVVCVENCPIYEVPNVFTPNGDGINDRFVPFPYRHVQDIDIKIYNRWGLLMFETTDPDINWNGVNQSTNRSCVDGTYYYILKVNEIRLSGIVQSVKTGFIQIAGSDGSQPSQ